MAVSRPTTGGSSGGAVGSTATIVVAVTSAGSDASNVNRPDALAGGDYSALPYATLQAALNALPKVLRHHAHVRIGAGTFAGAIISGFMGGGRSAGRNVGLNVIGSTAAFTPATGVATGTAGAGTTATTLVKPTAAANWTASNLVGKFLKITGGAGAGSDTTNFPVLRPIIANTTTSLTVDSIAAMDSTTTFQIVTMATLLEEAAGETVCLQPCFNTAPIRLSALGFTSDGALDSLIASTVNTSLELDGVDLGFATDAESFLSDKDGDVLVQNCKLSAASDILVKNNSTYVELRNLYCNGGSIVGIEDSHSAKVSMRSEGALSHALRLIQVGRAKAEVVANNGAATAVYVEGTQFEAVGTNKLTGSGNTGYGLQVEGSGRVDVTGCNITGTLGDILFFNVVRNWVTHGSLPYGILEEHAGSAILNAAYVKALKEGDYLFSGAIDVSGRFLKYGYDNPAFGETAVNLTNATPYDMETGGKRGGAIFNCTNAAGVAVLPSNCALAGVLVVCVNIGSQTMTLQAPSGGSISGTATVAAGAMAMFVSLFSNSGKDFKRVAL